MSGPVSMQLLCAARHPEANVLFRAKFEAYISVNNGN
jgi:hypothetical protein